MLIPVLILMCSAELYASQLQYPSSCAKPNTIKSGIGFLATRFKLKLFINLALLSFLKRMQLRLGISILLEISFKIFFSVVPIDMAKMTRFY